MKREDIIRMAREVADIETDYSGREEFIFDSYGVERFANLVAAAEREACAKVCESEAERVRNLHDRLDDGCIDALLGKELSARSLAFAIRERGAP